MTKKDMITLIQKREAELFLELKKTDNLFGVDNDFTKIVRSRWSGVNTLMGDLGIKSDLQLPENLEAGEMVLERYNQTSSREDVTLVTA
jgi:hypothetical protein